MAFLWARVRFPARVGLITGVCLGAIIAPASVGLYSLFYTNAVLASLGMVGLMLSLVHGEPGYELAIRLGVIPPATVIQGSDVLWVAILNGIVWSGVYGTAGSLLDWLRGTIVTEPANG